MKHQSKVVAGTALALVLGAGAVAAQAGPAQPAAAPEPLVVILHFTHFKYVDLPPRGKFSVGDFAWNVGKIYDAEHENVIGRFQIRGERVPRQVSSQPFAGALLVRGRGQLYTLKANQGKARPGAVVGGTGEFIGVSGEVGTEVDTAHHGGGDIVATFTFVD